MCLEYENQVKDYEAIVHGNEVELQEQQAQQKEAQQAADTLEKQLEDMSHELASYKETNQSLRRKCQKMEKLVYGHSKHHT